MASGSPQAEVLLDNLPGYPDNLMRGRDGRIWVGLFRPRNPAADFLAGWPFLRKVLLRLPRSCCRSASHTGTSSPSTRAARSLEDLQDPAALIPRPPARPKPRTASTSTACMRPRSAGCRDDAFTETGGRGRPASPVRSRGPKGRETTMHSLTLVAAEARLQHPRLRVCRHHGAAGGDQYLEGPALVGPAGCSSGWGIGLLSHWFFTLGPGAEEARRLSDPIPTASAPLRPWFPAPRAAGAPRQHP